MRRSRTEKMNSGAVGSAAPNGQPNRLGSLLIRAHQDLPTKRLCSAISAPKRLSCANRSGGENVLQASEVVDSENGKTGSSLYRYASRLVLQTQSLRRRRDPERLRRRRDPLELSLLSLSLSLLTTARRERDADLDLVRDTDLSLDRDRRLPKARSSARRRELLRW